MSDLSGRLLFIILGLPGFIPGIVLHELAHAMAAYKLGDPTAKHMGRISLRPEAHFDPLGALFYVISMFAGFGFGWAKPVPINPFNFRHPRRDFALSSLAGPVGNFLQIGVWAVLLRLFRPELVAFRSVLFAEAIALRAGDVLGMILTEAILINAVLCCFNLLPIPPLDGSRVLAYVLPERQAQVLDRLEPIGFPILFLLIFLGLFRFLGPYMIWLGDLFLRVLGAGL
jgi:Zn-dependent protease